MPIPQNSIAAAQATQQAAACESAARIRLIAGPGTGKSSVIEQRVQWLLNQGIPASRIFIVSFTRASARDLERRIKAHCQAHGHGTIMGDLRVSTLHALALRTLRAAGLLQRYPADPLVLDDWELTNIFDAEFGVGSGVRSSVRRAEIRRFYEAFWSTGDWNPPNYIPPQPPISEEESHAFATFHSHRSQVYSCVLPGEMVRLCVEEMRNGNINPVVLLSISHLVVDEYQDLNPMDQEFVDSIVSLGANIFVAGDDDQSVYSFRFASPAGIQTFALRHQRTADHVLTECFRCMPSILLAATSLITHFAPSQRIPKNIRSLYRHSRPTANGIVHRWRFANDTTEAKTIAESCSSLIQAGVSPHDILILLCNQRAQAPVITSSLGAANVDFVPPRDRSILEVEPGRLALAILRIVANRADYIAHRTLLGLRSNVGVATTHQICQATIDNNLNFLSLFYDPLPSGVFSSRTLTALKAARAICDQIASWQVEDTLEQHRAELVQIIESCLGTNRAQAWRDFTTLLPDQMSLRELRDYVWADNDEQQVNVLSATYSRLNQQIPETQVLPPRVRLMTMHGAKGLSSPIVFIPGLEEALIPGPRRTPYPGLVLEAARLFYVSITRARAVCVLSHARRRFMNGRTTNQSPSRFASHTGGVFVNRAGALSREETQQIVTQCSMI